MHGKHLFRHLVVARQRFRFVLLAFLLGASACKLLPPSATTTVGGPTTLAVDATAQLTATVTPRGTGPTSPSAAPKIDWWSSDPTRATVTSTGLVTGISVGTVTIYAAPVPFELGNMGRIAITVVQ